ncbi:hypothetical protein CRUP_021419, partial [Coryphaenoides rupestris]
MKLKRQKQAKKTLSFYKFNFGFRTPHQVLVDGTFCGAALRHQILLKEQAPKYLMGAVQLCTTSCVLKELESLGKELYGAKVILQRFQVRSCKHFQSPRVAAVQAGQLVTPTQQQSISSLKEQQGIGRGPEDGRGRKRKRKRSNPNPLSCLKKKRKAPPTTGSSAADRGEGEAKKGRRRHKKPKTEGGP